MSKENEHGRLIAAAAKAALLPLGCKRKGRSRLWIADQRFWVIVTEFQPSGWQKGSYLNVGAMWLWSVKEYWSFDYGHRVEDFIPFHDKRQFAAAAADLAARAADEVRGLRQKFYGPEAIAHHLVADAGGTIWSTYHAAVASGLVGHLDTARKLFRQIERWPATQDWQRQLQAYSAGLATRLNDQQDFPSAVLAVIQQSRARLGLPADPTCLYEIAARRPA
jgi:hypothetical protein